MKRFALLIALIGVFLANGAFMPQNASAAPAAPKMSVYTVSAAPEANKNLKVRLFGDDQLIYGLRHSNTGVRVLNKNKSPNAATNFDLHVFIGNDVALEGSPQTLSSDFGKITPLGCDGENVCHYEWTGQGLEPGGIATFTIGIITSRNLGIKMRMIDVAGLVGTKNVSHTKYVDLVKGSGSPTAKLKNTNHPKAGKAVLFTLTITTASLDDYGLHAVPLIENDCGLENPGVASSNLEQVTWGQMHFFAKVPKDFHGTCHATVQPALGSGTPIQSATAEFIVP